MSIYSFKNDRIGDMSVLAIKGNVNNGNNQGMLQLWKTI